METQGQPKPVRVILSAYGENYECKRMPMGWSTDSSSWIFGWESFGFNMKHSTEKLRFVKEDADWIRKQLLKYEISTEIDVTFQNCQNNWTYKTQFVAQMDFAAAYVNNKNFIEVDLYEGGLKKSISMNNSTNYEIGFDEDAGTIEVPEGMNIYEQARYVTSGMLRQGIGGINSPGLSIYSGEIQSPNIKFQSIDFTKVQENGYGFISTTKIGDSTINIYNAKLTISFISSGNSLAPNTTINIVKRTNLNDVVVGSFVIPGGLTDGVDYKFICNFPIVVDNNENSYYWNWGGFPGRKKDTTSVVVEFFGQVNTGDFKLKAYDVQKYGQKLLNKLHPGATFNIPALDVLPPNSKLFITTADAIRGIEGALIKTNLREFRSNIMCLFDAGVRVSNNENKYEIVDKKNVFDRNNKLLDIGEVHNIHIESLTDEAFYNVVNVGYEKQEYDYPLGRQDFACTLEFLDKLKINNKKMELISKYRADYTGVHLLHYDYVNSDRKDSKSDNDIFLILCFWNNDTQRWQAVKGDGVEVEEMEGGGYFNILLSPHWNLRRHQDYLRSMLWKHFQGLTYVSSTETMSNMVSTYQGITIMEKSDEAITPGSLIFKPITFRFDCVIPKNLSELLAENPNGYIGFWYNRIYLKGFPINIEGNTDRRSKQQVTLVAHPETPDDIQFKMFWKDPSKLY